MYYGIQVNLINYLTGRLGLSLAGATENVNTWTGTNQLEKLAIVTMAARVLTLGSVH